MAVSISVQCVLYVWCSLRSYNLCGLMRCQNLPVTLNAPEFYWNCSACSGLFCSNFSLYFQLLFLMSFISIGRSLDFYTHPPPSASFTLLCAVTSDLLFPPWSSSSVVAVTLTCRFVDGPYQRSLNVMKVLSSPLILLSQVTRMVWLTSTETTTLHGSATRSAGATQPWWQLRASWSGTHY